MRRATRLGRIGSYLMAQYPPHVAVPAMLATSAALWFPLEALARRTPTLGFSAAVAALTIVLFTLLLRAYDELKDAETDIRLGRAGDPKYKDRPLVLGTVDVADIAALRDGIVVLAVVANATLAAPAPFLGFAGTLALLWASSRWFFWPAVKRHLLLAFATHNPLSMVMSSYVVVVWRDATGAPVPLGSAALLVIGTWLHVAAWETSRKVRAPADETDYQTYSKVLGWRLATVVPAVFVAGSAALLALVALRCELRWVPWGLAGGALVFWAAAARFLARPTTASSNLRPFVELYALAASLGLPLEIGLRDGVRLA